MLRCLYDNDIDMFAYFYEQSKRRAISNAYSYALKLSLFDTELDTRTSFESNCIETLCVNGFKILHSHDPYDERYMHRLYESFWKKINFSYKINKIVVMLIIF